MLRLMVCRGLVPEASTEHHHYAMVPFGVSGHLESYAPAVHLAPPPPRSHHHQPLHCIPPSVGWLVVGRVWVGMGIGMDGDAGIGNGWGLGMGPGMRV